MIYPIAAKGNKSASSTFVTPEKRKISETSTSNTGETSQPRNASEVRDGDIPKCTNHPSSKTHWTWECKGGKTPGNDPKKKARSDTTSSGCTYCFNNPRLQKNLLTHSSANCRQDPANGFKQKGSYANQASLKATIRDVLNEQPDTKRSRDTKEEEDGECEPGRPLGSYPDDFEMDSEDSEKAARRKRRGKK